MSIQYIEYTFQPIYAMPIKKKIEWIAIPLPYFGVITDYIVKSAIFKVWMILAISICGIISYAIHWYAWK